MKETLYSANQGSNFLRDSFNIDTVQESKKNLGKKSNASISKDDFSSRVIVFYRVLSPIFESSLHFFSFPLFSKMYHTPSPRGSRKKEPRAFMKF